VATRGTYESLVEAQAGYYRSHRFADVFVRLTRAPEGMAPGLQRIPGVAVVQTRIVMDVSLDVPGLSEPAIGRMVSIPDQPGPMLNEVQVVRGRRVLPATADEVIASEAFAKANGLDVGDRIGAVLNGRWKRLTIVGIGLSPEYVYEVGPGKLFPDNRRFGVLWMARGALGPAFDLDGAFNDATLSLAPGALEPEVLAAVDHHLADYGALGTHGRDQHLSHRFLTDELGEIRIMTTFIPSLFLGVAAFLLYVVLSRLVSMQRTEIGLLKAFGRSDLRVGAHYLSLALAAVAIGAALGIPAGVLLGRGLVAVYRDYFHFPRLEYFAGARLVFLAVAVSAAAGAVGAAVAVRRAVRLPPAEAMRPEAPASFGGRRVERIPRLRLPPSWRMIVRNLSRRPVKAGLSVLGVAMAVALMVVGRFGLDAVNHMLAVQFDGVERADVTVMFREPLGRNLAHEVARLPGVTLAETFRSVPVRLRSAHREKRLELTGLGPGTQLRRLLDDRQRPLALPPEGLLLSRKLSQILDVGAGGTVSVEFLEGRRMVREVPVAGLVDDLIGLGAWIDAAALSRLLEEDATVSGALLRVRQDRAAALYAELKRMPAVAGVAVRSAMLASVRDTLDRSFAISSVILVGFACVIITGVVYNSARIALSERGRELASLGVLGFTRREVTVLLLGEQAVLVLLAMPTGLALGYGLCALLVPVFDRELFRVPLALAPWTFVLPVLVALTAALASGAVVARRIAHLDLVAVLKTRE
jgi:putative ABC transport system permease protein